MVSVVERFHWIDYLIFGLTLFISLAIGVYYWFKGQKSTSEFLLGSRKMPIIPTALSLTVTYLSGILILGFSSEMYLKGTHMFWHIAGVMLGMPLAAIVYQPVFYKLQLTSAYEYLELRFHSKVIRIIGSSLYVISTVLYMAIVLYAPAIALSAVSGIPLEVLIVVSGVVCTVYTSMGGLKAVVWTDAFQAILMYAGLIAIAIQGVIRVGGVAETWKIVNEGGRIFINFSPSPFEYMTFWGVLFGTAIGWMAIYGTNQSSVQRYTSLSSLRKSQLSLFLVLPGNLTLIPLVVICGLVMYAFYAYCDPLMLKVISSRDQLLPYFTVEVLGHIKGLPGIFLACLYSGTLSTVSSGLNSLAAVVWEDFIKPLFGSKISDQQATLISKMIACVFGILAVSLAIIAQYLGGVLQASLTVLNVFGGPLGGLFLFGMIFPWGNKHGALAGVLTACTVMLWICLGAQSIKPYRASLPRTLSGCSNETLFAAGFSGPLLNETIANLTKTVVADPELHGIQYIYKLSYMLYGLFGTVLVFVVGVPVSLITSKFEINRNDMKYMWPGFRYICGSDTVSVNQNGSNDQKTKEIELTITALERQSKSEM